MIFQKEKLAKDLCMRITKSILSQNSRIFGRSSFTTTPSQPAFTCSKFTIETLEQGVKYV